MKKSRSHQIGPRLFIPWNKSRIMFFSCLDPLLYGSGSLVLTEAALALGSLIGKLTIVFNKIFFILFRC